MILLTVALRLRTHYECIRYENVILQQKNQSIAFIYDWLEIFLLIHF